MDLLAEILAMLRQNKQEASNFSLQQFVANICAELYTTGIDEKDIISGLAGQYKTSTTFSSVKMASEKKERRRAANRHECMHVQPRS